MPSIRGLLFSIFYRFSYSFLLLILLVLLAVTPGDHVYQTISNGKLGNVFVVGGVYLVTALIALFIYASRLYSNRTALSAIPRVYIPIEKDEVSRNVRRMIVKSRLRSALVAWDSRPRDVRSEVQNDDHVKQEESTEQNRTGAKRKPPQSNNTIIPVSPESPPWGSIAHPGWSPPTSNDLPNVQYETVVSEFPSLIEAKAVSMAPPDPTYDFMAEFQDAVPPPPDPKAIALLQRPANMGLREYLDHLIALDLLDPPESAIPFLDLYEYARFSTDFLSESEFRDIMTAFSNLLASIVPLGTAIPSESALSAGTRTPEGTLQRGSGTAAEELTSAPPQQSDASSLASGSSVIHHEID